MSKTAFGFKEVLSLGWEALKKNILILISLAIIAFFAQLIANFAASIISLPAIIASLLSTAIGTYFVLSSARASYAAVQGQFPSWEVLKNDWKVFLKFFVVSLLLSVIFIISMLLLVIPFFFAFALFLCVPFIFVQNPEIEILEVFKKSWNISIKHIWTLLGYIFLWFLIILVTAIPTFGLALVITAPLFYVTSACVYKKLEEASKETTAAAVPTAAK